MKDIIRRAGFGPNSKVTQVDKKEANKRNTGNDTFIYLDKNGGLLATTNGSNIRNSEFSSKKQAVEAADIIYRVTPDETVGLKRADRMKQHYENNDPLARQGWGNSPAQRERANKLRDVYKNRLKSKLDSLKNDYKNAMKKHLDDILKKTSDETTSKEAQKILSKMTEINNIMGDDSYYGNSPNHEADKIKNLLK